MGMVLTGTAILVVVLRVPDNRAVRPVVFEPVHANQRFADAVSVVVREPEVSAKMQQYIAEWVEGEKFR